MRHPRLFAACFAFVCVIVSAAGCAAPTDGSEGEDTSSTGEELGTYDAYRGNRIADRALALWSGHPSRDLCLAGVEDSLASSGVVAPAFPRLPSAVAFDNWARANPGELAKRGFAKMSLDINHIPRGTIITWRPGQCGYSAQYGHIEIVSDFASSRACSDFCGNIRKNCGAPGMYVPIGSGGGSACSVHGDHRLYCTSSAGAPLHASPTLGSAVVNHLRTTTSWFTCWTTGDLHPGGNHTWYRTLGDDNGNWGFVPAVDLSTTSGFDANPGAAGLPHC